MTAEITDTFYDPFAPEVSIIILNFNRGALTAECLRHVHEKTTGRTYEVIVVDNGSAPSEVAQLENLISRFQLIPLPINRFFGEGNNIGVQASRGKYIVFLNNDAFVTENWLEPLINVLEERPYAGGVGPKFVYTDGTIQEAGAFIDVNGNPVQRGKFYRMEAEDLDTTTIVDYCSAACFATTRQLLDRVGCFDGNFEPAYYEDCDLCFKITSLGFFIYYCSKSVVYHIEHATTAIYESAYGLANIAQINRAKFLARWGAFLRAREKDDDANLPVVPPARRRTTFLPHTAPLAVFYTPGKLIRGGRERYLLTAASELARTHRTYIATEAPYSDYRLDYLGRELFLDLSGVSMATFADLCKIGYIDVFFHLGNHQFPVVSPRGRRNFFLCQLPFACDAEYLAHARCNLKGYDCILVSSRFIHDAVSAQIGVFRQKVDLQIVFPPVPVTPLIGKERKHAGKLKIVSIGRFSADGNKRHDVLIDAFQQLLKEGVSAELHLVGSLDAHEPHIQHFNMLASRARGLPIIFHTNVPHDVFQDVLVGSAIYWHAAGFGVDSGMSPEKCEHFGIGVVEAMANGCIPFVVASGGPPEFVREGDTGFQYRTVRELVTKTQALLSEPTQMVVIAELARQEAGKYGQKAFISRWRKLALG